MIRVRIRRFVLGIRTCRKADIPLTRHNLRAMWHQSEPNWFAKGPFLELTDEEWDAGVEAMEGLVSTHATTTAATKAARPKHAPSRRWADCAIGHTSSRLGFHVVGQRLANARR